MPDAFSMIEQRRKPVFQASVYFLFTPVRLQKYGLHFEVTGNAAHIL